MHLQFENVFEIDQAPKLFHEGSCVFLPLYHDYCQWLSVMDSLKNKVIYAVLDGEKIGYLLYNHKGVFSENKDVKPNIIKVYTLFISKPYRHQGYGTELLYGLLDLVAEDIKSVELKCKRDLYVGDFYKKRGFDYAGYDPETEELKYIYDPDKEFIASENVYPKKKNTFADYHQKTPLHP